MIGHDDQFRKTTCFTRLLDLVAHILSRDVIDEKNFGLKMKMLLGFLICYLERRNLVKMAARNFPIEKYRTRKENTHTHTPDIFQYVTNDGRLYYDVLTWPIRIFLSNQKGKLNR